MKKFFKSIVAVALSALMALGTTIYAETETTPTLTVSKSAVTVAIGKSADITVTGANGAEGTEVVAKSGNVQIATATLSGTKLTLAGVNAGVVDVKLTYGKLVENVTVTVPASTASPAAVKFYTDDALTKAVTAVDGIWAGGGKIKADDGTVTAYNTKTIYTNALATVIDPDVTDSKVVNKAGKIYVAVTASDVTAVPYDTATKKVAVDKESAQILKATYKVVKDINGGALTLTAGKNAGKVKVWVIDVNANNEIVRSAAMTVTVSGAASKMAIADATTSAVVTKSGVAYNGSSAYNLTGYLADGKTVASEASYTVSVAPLKDGSVIVDATLSKGKLTIKCNAAGKTAGVGAKTTVTITCNESGKKLNIPVTITNPVTAVSKAFATDSKETLYLQGEKVTLNITEATPNTEVARTDKVAVYVADENGLKIEGKKVTYTMSKGVKAAYKNGVLTLTRDDPFAVANVYLVYTDSVSGSVTSFKVATVAAIKISGGGIS